MISTGTRNLQHSMEKIIEQLKSILGDSGVLTGEDISIRSAGWGLSDNIAAKAILRPQSTEEVSHVLKMCHTANQTIVTHGGLTGLVRGSFSRENDIILSLERMNRIEEIDEINRTMTIQAGAVLQTVQETAETANLMFPLDLGARGSCTIGGNIATNAGGIRVIRYGMTRDLVSGLEAVLADGTIVSSLNKMIKNNSGYDLKQLFIGSEGTLGIVTRAVLRLQEQPKSQNTAFAAINSFGAVIAFLKLMHRELGGNLNAFEIMWRDFYRLVTTPPAKSQPPFSEEYPFYVLVESLGTDQVKDTEQFENALQQAITQSLLADAIITNSRSERNKLWQMRDDVGQLFRYGPVIIFDVSLAISDMEAYVDDVRRQLNDRWPGNHCFVFGHLGDGNLHIVVAPGIDDVKVRREIEKIVYSPLKAIGGSISAEHGVGIDKKPYLHHSRSEMEIDLMRRIKQALDPKNILNPGKIFD